ncbi:MAG: hypothetical protein JO233_09380 [Candidatus Eremiobacteraeota bacterium]|nr:hypothetical protein [Candidatus Eremiobacteraeota bacterium]
MPLQPGKWIANVGGQATELTIAGVDPSGDVSAYFGPTYPEVGGRWDEDSQRLTLLSWPQLFVAYLFTDPINLTGVNGTVFFTLAGVVDNFSYGGIGPSPTAKRLTFGWYAQIGVD